MELLVNKGPELSGKQTAKLVALAALVAAYFLLSGLPCPDGLNAEGQKAIALMVVVVIAWITEIIPIAISSLLFVFIQHIVGISNQSTAVANFATPTLLFVLASFFLAAALDASGLSRRMSLKLTTLSMGSPQKVLLYLMTATAVVSAFISDVPACATFFTIALALIKKNNCSFRTSNFAKSLMIGIPFASLIGGVATPAGSSLNVLTLSLLKSTSNINVSFNQWASIGVPVVIFTIPLVWKLLLWIYPPEINVLTGIEEIKDEYSSLGKISQKETKFIGVLAILLIAWFTEPFHKLPLPVTTTICSVLFFLPGIDLLSWDFTKDKIGWDTILLIGASNSLGTTLWKSGAANWLAEVTLRSVNMSKPLIIVLVVIVFTILIHLLVPVNAAIVSIMVPTLASVAVSMGINPAFLVVPMGFTVSAAFLLPLDPVPLITYSSGYYNMKDYLKAGWPVCIIWSFIMVVAMMAIARPLGLF